MKYSLYSLVIGMLLGSIFTCLYLQPDLSYNSDRIKEIEIREMRLDNSSRRDEVVFALGRATERACIEGRVADDSVCEKTNFISTIKYLEKIKKK